MTQSLIERIAVILRDHDAPPNKPYIKWEAYTTLAKMILEVMQEPTKAMVEAGNQVIPDNRGYSNDAKAVYKAMMEEAFRPLHTPTVTPLMELFIETSKLMDTPIVSEPKCKICNDTGMTGYNKPMSGLDGRTYMVFVPQYCVCGRKEFQD